MLHCGKSVRLSAQLNVNLLLELSRMSRNDIDNHMSNQCNLTRHARLNAQPIVHIFTHGVGLKMTDNICWLSQTNSRSILTNDGN